MRPDTLVIVNQSTGDLTLDVCKVFVKEYRNVYLITGRTKEPSEILGDSVNIIGITSYDKSSIVMRIVTWIKGSRQIWRALKSIQGPKDVLYFTNPPMSYMRADKMDDRFGIVEYDIYPDALLNVSCPSFIINWWKKRNRQVFNRCEGIITLSEGMKDQLAQYCPPHKIKVVPNWSTSGTPEIVPTRENKLLQDLGLENKFIVLYSGNIGYTHDLEILIHAANGMKTNHDVHFLIIGEGGKKTALQQMANDMHLSNVTFSGYLPKNELKYSLSAASLGVVTLTPATAKVSVPSKTYNLLAYGVPILNIAPHNSELSHLITKNGCGSTFSSDSIQSIIDFISICMTDSNFLNTLRHNAIAAGKQFTAENAVAYLDIFK